MKHNVNAAIALAIMFSCSALAVDAHHQPAAAGTAAIASLAEGEVRKVDKDANKITLRHGPIPSLDMPAMSMVFQVKAGDKIRFSAEKIGGQYVVTRIEPAQ